MTLFSWARRGLVTIESTTSRVSTTVSISAASTTRRMSECESVTRTYSVRCSSTFGGRRSTPMIASTAGSRSSACASRPPQYVDSPVSRIRLELIRTRRCAAGRACRAARPGWWRGSRGRRSARAPCPPTAHRRRRVVRRHRGQEADLELGGQVAQHPEQAEVREGRRDREVQQPGQALQHLDLGEHRRGLLGPDHRDGDDRRVGAHRRLNEAAAAEAAQAVAVLVELLGPLAALGEHEHELALVVEQAVHVRGVCRDGADLGQQHAEAGIALEEVLDGEIERARVGVLLLDRLGDHRRVGRQRAGVVGDQQRAALGRHVLDPLDLAAEPAACRGTRSACGPRGPRRAPSAPSR